MDLVMPDTPDTPDTPSDSSLEVLRYDCLSLSSGDLATVSPPQEPVAKNNTSEKIRLGRKGRSKSRTGCLNCKRARIKCKENRPICDYCLHRDLNCEWPDIKISQSGSVIRKPAFQPVAMMARNPQLPMPVFTIQDFRLFNHFIQVAYPHHPIGNDSIWKQDVPSIASDHEYLLHAMLALSASDLASGKEHTPEGSQLISTALGHRVKAISALNCAISVGLDRFEQANAMLATCFALLFQSTLLDDGLIEYMTFFRGTIALSIQMGCRRMKFLFQNLFGDQGFKKIDGAISSTPLIKPEVVAAACRSFERFSHLCRSKVETEVYTILYGIAQSLRASSRDAYLNLSEMYRLFGYSMPPDQFHEFVNPQNEVCKLLQAHFVALQLIMTPITIKEKEGRERSMEDNDGVTARWLIALHSNIAPSMVTYYEWTMWIEQEVNQGRIYNSEYPEEIISI